MAETIKWVPSGSQPQHCPHCHSENIAISENGSHISCNDCEGNAIVRYFKPKAQAKRSISREDLWAKMRQAGI